MPDLEKYLVLYPDGSMRWIYTKHENLLTSFYNAIGCDCLENVQLPFGLCCVVDESGKIKDPPQPLNPYASRFYPGTAYGDPLVGPVVFCQIGLVDGEFDWVPLDDRFLRYIELVLDKEIPK